MGIKNMVNVQEFLYDFSVDGGDTGTYDLSAKNGKSVIPVGAIIKSVTARVVTACTSDGSATVVWGNGDDADGFSGSTIAVGSLTENAIFNGWDNAAALLWDDTDDHAINPYVADSDDGTFEMTIDTAALTAGKIVFVVEYLLPAVEL